MKKIFKIDLALYPSGLLTVLTGLGFHMAGHGDSHRIWELWACVHILFSAAFLILIIQHLLTHQGWLKGLRNQVLRKKRRITIVLALFALAVTITGIALLFIVGPNTHVGLLHYRLGILFAIMAIAHSVRRFRIIPFRVL